MASSSLPVYDVVLSRSRKDADDFSYLLCKSLTSKGIRVLRGEDGQEVEGDTTTTSQELAIKESIKFAIVILSGNYASSPRLLEELSQILERKSVSDICVLPVFYHVDPSDVRHLKGVFRESFNKHEQVFKEDLEKVRRWRIALKEVANLSGWSSENRNQIEIIKQIVNFVVRRRDDRDEIELVKEIKRRRREQWFTFTKSTVKILPHKQHQVLHVPSILMCISAFSKFTTRGSELENIGKLSLHLCMLEYLPLLQKLRKWKTISFSAYKDFEELPRKKRQFPRLRYLDLSDSSQIIVNQLNTEDFEHLNHLQVQTNADFTDNIIRTAEIIEQPVDAGISNNSVGEIRINVNDGTTNATSSAEWNFLLTALVLEIFSAGFDQASSPRKPHYALIGMLLAIAAVLACTWELIHKGSLVLKRWQQLGCFYYLYPSNTLFDSVPDIFGLVSSISQCVFSTVQYIYFSHRVDSPIKLSLLPAIFLMCLAGSRLYRNQRLSSLTNDWV